MRKDILEYLQNSGDFISGQEISEALGVSRTAVWKHINILKKQGYEIESSTRKGYRLVMAPDLLTPEEIKNGLTTEYMGRTIHYVEQIDSTNRLAKEKAQEGAAEGTVIIAEEQVGGKGRLTRSWYSPFGKGIWMSVILRPQFLPGEASKLTLMGAVALTKAFHSLGLTDCGIKWPNDILVHGRKIVGVLTEMSATMEGIDYIVMGCGINVKQARKEFPKELKKIATSFAAENVRASRKEILQQVLQELEKAYDRVLDEGFAPILEEWRTLSVTLGMDVKVIAPDRTFYGKAIDIDEEGNLLVECEGKVEKVIAGDVSIRPKEE